MPGQPRRAFPGFWLGKRIRCPASGSRAILGMCDELRRLGDRGLAFAVQSERRARPHDAQLTAQSSGGGGGQTQEWGVLPGPGSFQHRRGVRGASSHVLKRELPAGDSRRARTGPNRKVQRRLPPSNRVISGIWLQAKTRTCLRVQECPGRPVGGPGSPHCLGAPSLSLSPRL